MLTSKGLTDEIKKLEDLTVKITEVRRSIRIEKFTFVLGFVEDLPITIMNSVLLLSYRDDIEYEVIYVSTLITLLEFGMKSMSFEKIMMLRSELKYLRQHVMLQRQSSVSKASMLDGNADLSLTVSDELEVEKDDFNKFNINKITVSHSNSAKTDKNEQHIAQELEKINTTPQNKASASDKYVDDNV